MKRFDDLVYMKWFDDLVLCILTCTLVVVLLNVYVLTLMCGRRSMFRYKHMYRKIFMALVSGAVRLARCECDDVENVSMSMDYLCNNVIISYPAQCGWPTRSCGSSLRVSPPSPSPSRSRPFTLSPCRILPTLSAASAPWFVVGAEGAPHTRGLRGWDTLPVCTRSCSIGSFVHSSCLPYHPHHP
jgi:hypothetical protein